MAKKALIILAEGFEEIEAITAIDILRRAGVEVTMAGLTDTRVKGSRGVLISAEKTFEAARKSDFDALILPGGMPGAANLAASPQVKSMHQADKIIAAICAAPSLVLAPAGILTNKSVTGFPGMMENFEKSTTYKETSVVVDANIITSRGPATALAFALAIAEKLTGKEIADKVRQATLAG
jgi:4-methyl-5(b-hydroxyethyl)-thiazole monophosphate biosynthesis